MHSRAAASGPAATQEAPGRCEWWRVSDGPRSIKCEPKVARLARRVGRSRLKLRPSGKGQRAHAAGIVPPRTRGASSAAALAPHGARRRKGEGASGHAQRTRARARVPAQRCSAAPATHLAAERGEAGGKSRLGAAVCWHWSHSRCGKRNAYGGATDASCGCDTRSSCHSPTTPLSLRRRTTNSISRSDVTSWKTSSDENDSVGVPVRHLLLRRRRNPTRCCKYGRRRGPLRVGAAAAESGVLVEPSNHVR